MQISSPIFYQGNKFRLLKHIMPLFPKEIDTFYDLFGGSATVSLNMIDKCKVVYNDFNTHVVELLEMFKSEDPEELDKYFNNRVLEYKLSKDIQGMEGYLKLREEYNKSKDSRDLYLLICYSICHLMRFNQKDEFNSTKGSGQYGQKNFNDIKVAHDKLQDIHVLNKNIYDFDFSKITTNDFVYFDPPYFGTDAVYNEGHNLDPYTKEDDYRLFKIIDDLHESGIKFGMSNVYSTSKNVNNEHLKNWAEGKYYVHHFNIIYSSFSESTNASEVYVTNVYNETHKKVELF